MDGLIGGVLGALVGLAIGLVWAAAANDGQGIREVAVCMLVLALVGAVLASVLGGRGIDGRGNKTDPSGRLLK